ncbi:MAG TPA: XRE family transcriptional regulator [Syntrophomonadaceae bacterium]|nr:XRE family transcriptional regulator [Syntrophomonadaceae bacterium]
MEELLIARQIRKIRIEKELTLEEVAVRSGFTKGLLSKIENNKVSPPVSTLAKIARALDISLGDLFSSTNVEQVKLVQKEEWIRYNPEHAAGGQIIETLMYGFKNQKMEPLMISIDNPDIYQVRHYNHPGQEFIFILEGSMKYFYADQEYLLQQGDALYFNAENLHGPLPISGQQVRYLSVLNP